jgi:AraC-like DNA-binding protein
MKYQMFDQIVVQVSELTTADHSEIFSTKRERAIVDSRFFIIYIAEQVGMSRSYIKRFFKLHGFDIQYRMINYSFVATKKRLKKDKYLKEKLNEIINTYKILENE